MKYTVEMTEEEYRQVFTTAENIVKTLCETAITMEKLRIERARAGVVDNGVDEVIAPSPKAAPVAPQEDAKVIRFDRVEKPTGEDLGRGDTRGVEPRAEEPLPTSAVVTDALLAKGRKAFQALVDLWRVGFNDPDAEQPDRAEAMRNLANGRKSYAVLVHVGSVGGLTHAVNDAMMDWEGEESRRREAVTLIAGNVTQVASILFPDLSDLYEHKNIFSSGDTDDE
jgi:hypothetical protein